MVSSKFTNLYQLSKEDTFKCISNVKIISLLRIINYNDITTLFSCKGEQIQGKQSFRPYLHLSYKVWIPKFLSRTYSIVLRNHSIPCIGYFVKPMKFSFFFSLDSNSFDITSNIYYFMQHERPLSYIHCNKPPIRTN